MPAKITREFIAKLDSIHPHAAAVCFQHCGKTRPAYYTIENRSFFVMFADNPGETWRGGLREFEAKFTYRKPEKPPAMREKWDAMPSFWDWRGKIRKGLDNGI